MSVCSATSYPFGFSYRIKSPPIEILKFLVTILRNQDKKVTFIQVDEDGARAIYFELINSCHNMNIIVQTTGGDSSSLNVKTEIPYDKIANITRALLLNSSHKK